MTHRRLNKIIELINQDESVLDVGTDHAIVPIQLYNRNITKNITATEVIDNTFQNATSKLLQSDLQTKVKLIKTDGLNGLDTKDYDAIIISGMGTETIIKILSRVKKISSRLILQPTTDPSILRKYLSKHNFKILDEYIVIERKRFFPIIVCKQSFFPSKLTSKQQYLGPKLQKKASEDEVKQYYDSSYKQLDKLIKLRQSTEDNKKMKWLKEI